MNIRKVIISDYEEVAKVHAASFHKALKGLVPDNFLEQMPVEKFVERWRSRLANPETMTYLAETNKRIVGLVTFVNPGCIQYEKRESVEVKFLYIHHIHPDHWRLGIGVLLILTIADEMQKMGCDCLYGWALKNNPQSRSFYEKLGAKLDGAEQFFQGGTGNGTQVRYTLEINNLMHTVGNCYAKHRPA